MEISATENKSSEFLKQSVFNSEFFKLEIRNLGYFGIGELKKLLKKKLELDFTKIKAPIGKDFAFVCLRSDEERAKAIKILNGYKWKGRELRALVSKASRDPFEKRREKLSDPEYTVKKRCVEEAACPLSSLPYDQQLEQKKAKINSMIQKFQSSFKKVNFKSNGYLENFNCEELVPSPQINAYRNKNEFTVGKNSNNEVVVGFRLFRYSDGSSEVAEVEQLLHIPDAAKWAAKSFQDFMRSSAFLAFEPETNRGHVKQLMVRNSTQTKEIMLVVGVVSSNLSEDELEKMKNGLVSFYENLSEKKFKCTSLYYQDVKNREVGQIFNPVMHLYGNTHITDEIHNLQFRISPLSFFQVNTYCANTLYQKVIDLAAPTKNSIVLDICCGTGTIALAFAKHCKQVIGVEIVDEAVKDAEYNANLNGITNCKFFTGNADDYIQCIVKEAVYNHEVKGTIDLIAIIDPPRAGLHSRSIASIRACPSIKKLIYVSCDPESAQRNWIDLGRPESKQYKGNPFFPKTAVAVDMFPHTFHIEMVILFERETNIS